MAWLVQVLSLLALVGGAAFATAQASDSRREREVLAVVKSNGFAVRLTATRERLKGEPDTATVRIAAFERSRGSWDRMGKPILVGRRSGWFWHVVTGRYGVCVLRLAQPGGECPERVALRMLISPSIGPSATFRFATCEGEFRAVDV
jgi:hypothetical protein